MNDTPEDFTVMQRTEKFGQQALLELDCPHANDTLSQGGCICRTMAQRRSRQKRKKTP